jgi:hypothetical protein
MKPENGQPRSLLLSDLIEALEFVSASQYDEHRAYADTSVAGGDRISLSIR